MGRRRRWRSSCLYRRTVDCWIGIVDEVDRRLVRLAGRLGAGHVPELLRACDRPGPVCLDLTDLISADLPGVEALQRIRARGARLVGVPVYIQMRLDSPSGGPPSRNGT